MTQSGASPATASGRAVWRTLPIRRGGPRGVASWLPGAVVIMFVGWQLAHFGYRDLIGMLPSRPGFYVALIMLYLTLPVSEMVIFRRVWGVPANVLFPLLRKAVINDVVLSYGGEVALYAWARRSLDGRIAPFGAIKDVSVLSAVVGNLVTLVTMMIIAPLAIRYVPPDMIVPTAASVLLLLVAPLLVLAFSRRVFSLPGDDLRFIARVHFARLVASLVLTAMLWRMVLPGVALSYCIGLLALRLLVSRLPLVPNKDMLFASIVVLVVGHDNAVAVLISLTAMAFLALHLACFSLLTIGGMLRRHLTARWWCRLRRSPVFWCRRARLAQRKNPGKSLARLATPVSTHGRWRRPGSLVRRAQAPACPQQRPA